MLTTGEWREGLREGGGERGERREGDGREGGEGRTDREKRGG